ncbi:MAG TPA: ADP-ribosylglycohydrolase family protein [Phycisphaerae bacterium]|nr:ADP-ribosylglycohydrolase family protein [Phycisphaerae bacterium]
MRSGGFCLAMALCACAPALGDRILSADSYRDKLHGMWVGQLLGNYAGRPREGYVERGGLDYEVDWPNVPPTTGFWDGDDDTCFEFLYADVLNVNADPNRAQIGEAWSYHIYPEAFYFANRHGRRAIEQGFTPPQTGSQNRNTFWYAIDSQITTETLGALAPGMRQRAADLVGRFGSVTNTGYALHAAQFYGAMYAAAAFEPNVHRLVESGLEVVPLTSRSHQIIQDVRSWYEQDMLDGNADWRTTQALLYDKYCEPNSLGRYYHAYESSINLGATVLSLLYGEGDFKQTVEIGVQAGFDADCNPATAGGLIGLTLGYSGLPSDLTGACPNQYVASGWLRNLEPNRPVAAIVDGLVSAAESQIILGGGSVVGSDANRTYYLPDADPVAPPAEKYDPNGPKGLVGAILARGGRVTVSASVEMHNADNDRQNLESIIDGVTDVSYNGHRAYSTEDGNDAQPSGGDWYQLTFDRDVLITSVAFYEGEYVIRRNWLGTEPNNTWGGFFEDLAVEVGDNGVFAEVPVHFSEALDPNEFFQVIELTLDEPVTGDAVRIVGTAGGMRQYTTIIELEVYGSIPMPGDATLDGMVGLADLGLVGENWQMTGARWTDGDFTNDGVVGLADLGIVGAYWGEGTDEAIPNPEPTSGLLLWLGAMAMARCSRPVLHRRCRL